MDIPLIFQEYHHDKAEQAFPTITTNSDQKEVTDIAWIYAIDLMRKDPILLQEAYIGEYLDSVKEMDELHQQILQGIADENHAKVGKLVEWAISAFVQRTVEYIEEHMLQMELRHERP